MTRNRVSLWLAYVFIAGLVSACGGGGGGGSAPATGGTPTGGGTTPDQPTTTTAFSFDTGVGGSGGLIGRIQAFGSIFINGVEMETSSSDFYIEGEESSESELKEGHYIIVVGDIEGRDASEVHYRSNLKGPVTGDPVAIDALAGRYEIPVMGQTVVTTSSTRFDGVLAGNIVAGNELEVSGPIDSAGRVVATYIELKSSLPVFKAIGTVASLDTTARTFLLGTLVVDYSSAQLSEFEGAALADGQFVEVKVPRADFTAPTATDPARAVASEVELLPRAQVGEGAEVEVEGYIDRFASATDFSVGGINITTNSSTVYEDGDASRLALNVKIEAEGRANADGVIVARKVEFKRDNAIRVEGPVSAVNVTNSTVTAVGVTFEIRRSTELDDGVTLDGLMIGDFIEARGYLDGDAVVAVELERDDPDDRARLRGPVTAINKAGNTISIQNVAVVEQDGTTQYRDDRSEPELNLTRDQFYNALQIGREVEADWRPFSSLSEPARELSLEDSGDDDDGSSGSSDD